MSFPKGKSPGDETIGWRHTVQDYKFKAGQSVELRSRKGSWFPPGPFSIVRPLPSDRRENQYRLKSKADGQEFVADESDLSLLRVV